MKVYIYENFEYHNHICKVDWNNLHHYYFSFTPHGGAKDI